MVIVDIGSLMNHVSGLGYVVPNIEYSFVVALFMKHQVPIGCIPMHLGFSRSYALMVPSRE